MLEGKKEGVFLENNSQCQLELNSLSNSKVSPLLFVFYSLFVN